MERYENPVVLIPNPRTYHYHLLLGLFITLKASHFLPLEVDSLLSLDFKAWSEYKPVAHESSIKATESDSDNIEA